MLGASRCYRHHPYRVPNFRVPNRSRAILALLSQGRGWVGPFVFFGRAGGQGFEGWTWWTWWTRWTLPHGTGWQWLWDRRRNTGHGTREWARRQQTVRHRPHGTHGRHLIRHAQDRCRVHWDGAQGRLRQPQTFWHSERSSHGWRLGSCGSS